jgi:hypothetical protein
MACELGQLSPAQLGEDVTWTLESVPRHWKVIETVRKKFSCRDCEKISQAPPLERLLSDSRIEIDSKRAEKKCALRDQPRRGRTNPPRHLPCGDLRRRPPPSDGADQTRPDTNTCIKSCPTRYSPLMGPLCRLSEAGLF